MIISELTFENTWQTYRGVDANKNQLVTEFRIRNDYLRADL